ncbi:MAG: hypothetical protein DWQ07_22360 [Chloroflexi bacterium]|nr:MAG: hypothetical protein DWQ07_22360 [Chloroflexota bacterium]MBL1193892.1 hypothetical protein [Chloroflexota bacterium]
MIWPAGQDALEILASASSDSRVQVDGSIVSYTASDSAHELALVIERVDSTFEILWLSSQTLDVETIGEFFSLPEVKISPNGRWLAYREEESVEIFAVDLDEPEKKISVGICKKTEMELRTIGCRSFHWSPNGAQLAWTDGRGLWIAQPPAYEKKVLNNYRLHRIDEEDTIVVGYGIISWSPNSRYLILVRSRYIEGGLFELLDAQNGNLVEIPGTFQHGDTLPLFVTWLDGYLFSVNSRDGRFERGPGAAIWRIDPSSHELLLHENRYFFGMPCGIVTDTGLYDDHHVYYVISHVEREYCLEDFDHGLYFSSLPGSYPILHQELPGYEYWYGGFLWSPDDQFSIMFVEDWSILNLEEETVENFTSIIGRSEDICCFTWVE